MTIRAAILDIYGTVLEVGPPPADADVRWRRLFQDRLQMEPRLTRLDFSLASSEVIGQRHQAARALGIPSPEIHWPSVVLELLPELAQLPPPDQDEFVYGQIQTTHTTRLRPATAAALLWLKQRLGLLGIASNAQAYTLRELREALSAQGLGMDLFERDLSFWSFQHGFSKPDPHVFQTLTARLAGRGVSPGETLMIGDRFDNDIQPARAHGWQTWQLGAAGDGTWAGLRKAIGASQSPKTAP